jgi:beta-mannosidase
VVPVYYSDNYVSLLPNESRTITIEAATGLKEGALVVVDGWNVG